DPAYHRSRTPRASPQIRLPPAFTSPDVSDVGFVVRQSGRQTQRHSLQKSHLPDLRHYRDLIRPTIDF
ncbi:hypothetical protein, partial [Novipirellula maiorica]|uniref:hypothetical protein n=1 Tax=Novipirellula maiorica TaxID=1265734 RepID=UPI00059267CD